jgi:hypothetical protein
VADALTAFRAQRPDEKTTAVEGRCTENSTAGKVDPIDVEARDRVDVRADDALTDPGPGDRRDARGTRLRCGVEGRLLPLDARIIAGATVDRGGLAVQDGALLNSIDRGSEETPTRAVDDDRTKRELRIPSSFRERRADGRFVLASFGVVESANASNRNFLPLSVDTSRSFDGASQPPPLADRWAPIKFSRFISISGLTP